MLKRTVIPMMFFGIFVLQLGFLDPEHSVLETATKNIDGETILEFKVLPKPGHQLTQEGPWSLDLTNIQGLNLSLVNNAYIIDAKSYDASIPGFKVVSKSKGASNGAVTYKLRAFICTDDKTRCFPEVHKGVLSW